MCVYFFLREMTSQILVWIDVITLFLKVRSSVQKLFIMCICVYVNIEAAIEFTIGMYSLNDNF